MALYTETEINQEIWNDRAFILSQTHPEDSASEYADSSCPIYYTDIADTWRDLPDEYSNKFHEITDTLPERVEDLMKLDIYLYYFMIYSGAIQSLIDGNVLINDEWLYGSEPED
jgi:hypothetical protein